MLWNEAVNRYPERRDPDGQRRVFSPIFPSLWPRMMCRVSWQRRLEEEEVLQHVLEQREWRRKWSTLTWECDHNAFPVKLLS